MKRKIKDIPRRELSIIAKEYAMTPNSKSGEHFSEKYRISVSTFYKILHKAVLESMVTEDEAKLISKKAASNAERHGGEGAKIQTLETYNKLIKARKDYRFEKEEAKKWCKRFIISEYGIGEFCKNYCLEVFILRRALADSIEYSWISDEELSMLKEKLPDENFTKEKLDQILERRTMHESE